MFCLVNSGKIPPKFIFPKKLLIIVYFFLNAMFLTSKLTLVFCWRGTESWQNLLKASISFSTSSISPFSRSMSLGAKMLSEIQTRIIINKTGLQPVSRPVERVHYLGGGGGGVGVCFGGKNVHFANSQNERSKTNV